MNFKKYLKKINDIVAILYKDKIDCMNIKKSEKNIKFLDISIINMAKIGI